MFLYYGHIQWNSFVGDPDGFYHARLAKWLSEGKLIESLPWMKYSSLAERFTDHHLLYHLLLAPFVNFFDPLIGVKIASAVFSVVMVLLFYWLIKKMGLRWPMFFALAFLLLNGLNFRVSLIKANSLSIAMLWLIIYSLFEQKTKTLLVLSFLFVWLYGGWPLAIFILIIFIISQKIYQSLHTNKLKIFLHQKIHILNHGANHKLIRISIYLLAGIVLGIILNPYWPQNLYLYYQQFLQIGVVNMGNQFTVGSEWYGTSLINIIYSSPHLFTLAFVNFLILSFNLKKISRLSWFSFILAFAFMVLTLKSKRYVEYYMPFMLLFAASSTTDVHRIINYKKIKQYWEKFSKSIRATLLICLYILTLLIMPSVYDKILSVRLSDSYPLDKFEAASQWLSQNSPAQSIVFHSDWDEWPILFYHNPHNYYIIGLDPTFMENYNSGLHKLYRDITIGNVNNDLSDIIKRNFNAQYVFVDKVGHENFSDNLNKDKNMSLVYEDKDVLIYKIN